MIGQPVTLLHGAVTSTDGYNNDVVTYTSEQTTAAFVPGARSEATEGTEETITTGEVYFTDLDISVSALDRIVIGSVTFEVTGDPSQWQSPFTQVRSPVMVHVRQVKGAEAHVAQTGG